MPRIETYSSTGPTQFRRAEASDFADTRGMRQMSESLDQFSAKLNELRDTEDRLLMARTLAEGRQYWLKEMDARQRQVEETGEYVGFTDRFNSDYATWMDETVSKFPNQMKSEELRTRLIEMQTPIMGDAMGYEAAQRALKIRENYNAALVPYLTDIKMSGDKSQLQANLIGGQSIVESLPPQLKKEATAAINLEVTAKEIDLAESPEEVDEIVNSKVKAGGFTDDQARALTNGAIAQKNSIKVKAEKGVQESLIRANELAATGSLNPGWQIDIVQNLRTAGVENNEEIQAAIRDVDFRNRVANEVWGMSNYQYEESTAKFQVQLSKETDPNKQIQLAKRIGFYQEAWRSRNELLSKDFSVISMQKSDRVKSAYDKYAEISKTGDFEKSRAAFSEYVTELDAYATDIQWNGDVNYLPTEQVDAISKEIATAMQRENGAMQVADLFDNYRQMYGDGFSNVMRQIRAKDESLGALSMIPRIMANDNENLTAKRNVLVQAIVANKQDPKRLQAVSALDVPPPDSEYTDVQETLGKIGANIDLKDRNAAYQVIARWGIANGDHNAIDTAASIAYGDLKRFSDRVVYPSSVKDIYGVIDGANSMLGSVEATIGIQYLQGMGEIEQKQFMEKPSNYVTWETNKNGSGVRAIWADTYQPVLDADGDLIEYSWDKFRITRKKDKSMQDIKVVPTAPSN